MQPVFTTVSTPAPWQAIPGVWVGNDYGKTRLYSPIRSKIRHHSAQQGRPIQSNAASFRESTARPLKDFQKMLGLMAAALPVLQLGLLHMRPIQYWLKQRVPSAAWRHGHHRIMVTRACVSALARWRDPFWLKQGVILDTAHRRKVVMTDASNKGWGALCEGVTS